jgi:hypothetical protein
MGGGKAQSLSSDHKRGDWTLSIETYPLSDIYIDLYSRMNYAAGWVGAGV